VYSTTGSYTLQQVSDAPTGFVNSYRVTVTSPGSSTASSTNAFHFEQKIEGFNIADLMAGTSSAATVTLSFWIKSSITGTYSLHFGNDTDRYYVTTYTVNSANTWEYKTVTITLATSGTWNRTNGRGLEIVWSLLGGSTYTTSSLNQWLAQAQDVFQAAGAVQFCENNGATWQITGVQLERGTTATSFDVLPYGTELGLCQRYCIKVGGDTSNVSYQAFGMGGNTTTALLFYYPQTAFRTTPSLASYTGLVIDDTNGSISISNLVLDPNGSSPNFVRLNATATGLAQFRPYFLRSTSSTGNLILSAEL
jgi:hypothetical protein